MTVASYPTAGNYPRKLGKRESKVIEAAKAASFAGVSGDVTINTSGVAALGTGVIVNADISDTAAIALNKLIRTTGDAGKILQCAASTGIVTATSMSGDVTIAAGGATTIGANKIRPLMVAAADGTAGQVLTTNGSNVFSFASAVLAEKTATLSVSEAQLLALNGATGGDLEIVAAQAGVAYIPTAIQIFADYSGAEYTAGDDLVIVAGTVASGVVLANIDKTAFIPGTTADAHFFATPDAIVSSASSKGVALTVNAPLSLNIKSGGSQFTDPGTAAGTFKVKVFYREIALLT